MKRNNMMNRFSQGGFNLLEVLIGIAIFAIGMMALASLQGNLTRSASDANVRMVAVNLAEQQIESRRGFARLTDPTDTFPTYDDIVSGTYGTTIEGTAYTVTTTVVDYYYDMATDSFVTTAPSGALFSDYKEMTVNVSWTPLDLRTVEGTEIDAEATLGTGEVTVVETISSVTSAASSKVITQTNEDFDPYSITYTPGQNPDIVSLSLGNNKFKESLTPQPDVIRSGELVDTRFDVITYSQDNSGTFFVRREEFASVSCDCTLRAPSGAAETSGRRPMVWGGDEYVAGHWVDKPYGESANNQQSSLCVTCCRDHHDGGSATDDHADTAVNQLYPFRATGDYVGSGTFSGDHKHYARSNTGVLTEATAANDDYVEACRLVRVDGFFRLVQDFRQEDLNIFPADFLDEAAEITTYSNYVTTAADDYENASYPNYEIAPPCIGGPSPCVEEPVFGAAYPTPLAAGEFPSWTQLPLGILTEQQLRSRGIYIDYLTYDLRTVIDCLRAGGDEDSCKTGDVELDINTSTNVLEIIPFFDVQMTWLFRWNETPTNTPIDTTNEGLEDDNTHSRGLATQDDYGSSTVESTGHMNNLSFTDTAAIDPNFAADTVSATINVQAVGATPPPPVTGDVVSGNISETVNGIQATDIEVVGGGGAQCDRTPGGYECTIPDSATVPTVKFYGYGGVNKNRWGCLTGNVLEFNSQVQGGIEAYVIYNLYNAVDPQPVGAGYDINVQQDNSCN